MIYVNRENWDDPVIMRILKREKPIIRHFNYSLKGDNSYKVEFIREKLSGREEFKRRYIKNMMARAHGVQIGHLRIYFSGEMPIGLYHPGCGPLCVDNFWDKQTAYHLNRINRRLDDRLSLEHFHTLLIKSLENEVKESNITLYIPYLNDVMLNNKLHTFDYIDTVTW